MTKAGWCGRCAVERVGVRLMTTHQARGLEVREVFVVGISAEELPDPAPMKYADTDPKRMLVDGSERRLFHICATRAAHELQFRRHHRANRPLCSSGVWVSPQCPVS